MAHFTRICCGLTILFGGITGARDRADSSTVAIVLAAALVLIVGEGRLTRTTTRRRRSHR